jgi:hypothetical protein
MNMKATRHAPGLYTIGDFAISRECEDWSCGCERYAIRRHYGDPLVEMGDWLATSRLLKDALAIAETM